MYVSKDSMGQEILKNFEFWRGPKQGLVEIKKV